MKLTGEAFRQLVEAILDAFSYNALAQVLRYELDVNIDEIASPSENKRVVVYQVVRYFEKTDSIEMLLEGLLRANPTNKKLAEVTASWRPDEPYEQEADIFPQSLQVALDDPNWMANHFSVDSAASRKLYSSLHAIIYGLRSAMRSQDEYFRRLELRNTLERLDNFGSTLFRIDGEVDSWMEVLDYWRVVINQELSRLVPTEGDISANPYQVGNPLQLSQNNLFKGRTGLRDTVLRMLSEQGRPTLLLYGPRRMGKTSFLYQLPALLPGNTIPVLIDLQPPAKTRNNAAFLYHIANAIHKAAGTYRIPTEAPNRSEFKSGDPFELFDSWLETDLIPRLDDHDYNLLLEFDEFEKLGLAVQNHMMTEEIYDELRHLIQHQSRLAFLFAGVQTFDALGPNWSSYFINVRAIEIDYLKPSEARELIVRPNPNFEDFNLTYDDEVVEKILSLTRGQPLLIQLICSCCVEVANDEATNRIASKQLERAIAKSLDQGETLFFRYIWDEVAGNEGRSILKAASIGPIRPRNSDMQLVQKMVNMKVLSRKRHKYEIEIPLVRRWLLEKAPDI